jgi:bacillithiol system protein YtxJ
MHWIPLEKAEQLQQILADSHRRPQAIFKHSTTCSVSQMAKSRLERGTAPEGIDFHYLDLLSFRSLSNKIAEDLHVWHESPQLLLVKNGTCVYNESHIGIRMDDLPDKVQD